MEAETSLEPKARQERGMEAVSPEQSHGKRKRPPVRGVLQCGCIQLLFLSFQVIAGIRPPAALAALQWHNGHKLKQMGTN